MNSIKLKNHVLTTPFQTRKLVIHVAKMQQIWFFCPPNNDECQLTNWKCVLQKCTACAYIALPGFERDSYNQGPMIMFNTYMTQFTCSNHGILIRKKLPLIWMQTEHLKMLISYVNN